MQGFAGKNNVTIICLVLLVWTVIVFFPGSYSVDSWSYYYQVLSRQYNDWHGPIMPFTWKLLVMVTGRYFSIYILQMCLYWYFFYLLLRVVENKLTLVIGFVLAGLFLFIPQYVIKDTVLCMVWGTASLFLISAEKEHKKRNAVVAFILYAYGLFIRPNEIVAIIPLLYILTGIYLPSTNSFLKKSGVVIAVSVILLSGYYIFTYKILNSQRTYPEYKLKLLDVVGISKKARTDYMPACIAGREDYHADSIWAMYTPASFDDIYWSAKGTLVPQPDDALNKCLTKSWKRAILDHPFLYIQNRFEGFLYYLRIKKRFPSESYWNASIYISDNNPVNTKVEHTGITKWFADKWHSWYETVFFDPWLWLLLNTVFFIVFFLKYRKYKIYTYHILAQIQLSGILFMLAQFPVYQHDRDFRYNYWNVFVFIIGFIYCFREHYLPRSSARSKQDPR